MQGCKGHYKDFWLQYKRDGEPLKIFEQEVTGSDFHFNTSLIDVLRIHHMGQGLKLSVGLGGKVRDDNDLDQDSSNGGNE